MTVEFQGQKFGENPRFHSRKDSRQQNYENLNGFSQLFQFIIQSYTTKIHGFLQNSTGRIQMDSCTWSQISDPELIFDT